MLYQTGIISSLSPSLPAEDLIVKLSLSASHSSALSDYRKLIQQAMPTRSQPNKIIHIKTFRKT